MTKLYVAVGDLDNIYDPFYRNTIRFFLLKSIYYGDTSFRRHLGRNHAARERVCRAKGADKQLIFQSIVPPFKSNLLFRYNTFNGSLIKC
jgi:hypothetical protein